MRGGRFDGQQAKRNRKWVERARELPASPKWGGKCIDGKIGWLTKEDAKRQLIRMKNDGMDTSAIQIFKCPICGLFHLGNNNSGATREQMRNNRKQKGP